MHRSRRYRLLTAATAAALGLAMAATAHSAQAAGRTAPAAEDAPPSRETDWTGALSSWGVALQRTGDYTLDTLPSGSTITYGGSGALDLKNFDEFVLPEPNIRLTTAEKTALMKFVQNGGGLFLISDHTGSERNNHREDSPGVIKDLLTNKGGENI